jgi:hypothetical protein
MHFYEYTPIASHEYNLVTEWNVLLVEELDTTNPTYRGYCADEILDTHRGI